MRSARSRSASPRRSRSAASRWTSGWRKSGRIDRANDREIAIEDADAPDDEPQLVGEAVVDFDPLVAPEEAALSIRDRAPGAVDHEDDYVEE